MERTLESHWATMVERCHLETTALAVQGTAILNYDGPRETGDPGGGKGLLVHAGLMVAEAGRPLGLFTLDSEFRASNSTNKRSRRWLQGFGRTRELALACPKTRIIAVFDRDDDIWPLLRRAQNEGPGILALVNRSKRRRVFTKDGGHAGLHDHVAAMAPLARRTVEIASGKRTKRMVALDLRAGMVILAPHGDADDRTPTRMLAVSATETTPAKGKAPLCWLFLTTEGGATAEMALRVIDWHERRWSVEHYLAILKTNTCVKNGELDEDDDLHECLAFDAITACRVHDLGFLSRGMPGPAVLAGTGQPAGWADFM